MPTPRSPLLSLDAHGSVADTLTFQGNSRHRIARSKPTLPYFLTLPAQYQRWLFSDYAYLWTQQPPPTQALYRAQGHRYHRTAYQQWMAVMLATLPDILGIWRMDRVQGGIVQDYSRAGHHLSAAGPSATIAVIDNGLQFDGVNDRAFGQNTTDMDITTGPFTLELFFTGTLPPEIGILVGKGVPFATSAYTLRFNNQGSIHALMYDGGPLRYCFTNLNIADGGPHHVVYYRDTTTHRQYISMDGAPYVSAVAPPGSLTNNRPFQVGHQDPNARYATGVFDHIIMRNIAFPYARTHYNRRWPQ